MNCTTCMIDDFKHELCSNEFCEKCGAEGTSEDVESIFMKNAVSKWIPCSERLPSECDEFLITWTASVTNKPLLAFAEYEPDALLVSGGKWYLEDDMREFKDVDVIAWMPLPEPWKGAGDETD